MTKTQAGDRLPYLLGKLKAPRVLERLQQTAETARAEGWPYEQFLEALLEAEALRAMRPARETGSATPRFPRTRAWRTSTSARSRRRRSR